MKPLKRFDPNLGARGAQPAGRQPRRPFAPTDREEWLRAARDFEAQGRWSDAMHIRADLARHDPRPIDLKSIQEAPWRRGEWFGDLVLIGACPADDFDEDDVDIVLGYGDTGKAWDGLCAGIARLKDGRFIAWESSWGATGSGFSGDAYGGDADIAIARTAGGALSYISERGREMIRWA